MTKQKEAVDSSISIEQLKNWKRGEPWSKTEERNINMHNGYPQANIPKSFLNEVHEALYDREIVLISRDPKTHVVFREIRLIVPKKLSKDKEAIVNTNFDRKK